MKTNKQTNKQHKRTALITREPNIQEQVLSSCDCHTESFQKADEATSDWANTQLSCSLAKNVEVDTPAQRHSNYSAIPWPIKTLCTMTHLPLPSDICLNLNFSVLLQTYLSPTEKTEIHGIDKNGRELTHLHWSGRIS